MSSPKEGVAHLLDFLDDRQVTPEEHTLDAATFVPALGQRIATPQRMVDPVTPSDLDSPRTLLVMGRTAKELTPGPATASSLTPGRVLAGRYQLESLLGAGGTSLVFRATDLAQARVVALKVFNLPGDDDNRVARFKQEFRLARELSHPNIVRLLEVASDGELHFLAMELLRGETLKSAIQQRPTLAEALRFLTHATVALEYAHQKSVIHRDVKPTNLFVTQLGIVKLMDFGLAVMPADPRITAAGALLGTPEYMAPEQITGEHAPAPATDLYSLGVVAYELVTGTVPFKHPQLMPLLFMHVKETPRPPRELNPVIPVELERVILKLLQKAPADRFTSATQLRAALRALWPAVLKASGAPVPGAGLTHPW